MESQLYQNMCYAITISKNQKQFQILVVTKQKFVLRYKLLCRQSGIIEASTIRSEKYNFNINQNDEHVYKH